MDKPSDPVLLEVVHNRLEAIVEQMSLAMLKTAQTSILHDARDYSVALLTLEGELMAIGQCIPHHQGGMQSALMAILDIYPLESMEDGDVYMINDSYLGGTHTQDFCVIAPIFLDEERILFAGCFAHHIDIGGMTAGGYCVAATNIYQEGTRFPGVKLIEKGQIRTDILRTFMRNVRLPQQQKGDLLAQVAALHVGAERVRELAIQYGVGRLKEICGELLNLTERRVRAEIEKIPDGVYEVVDYLDHDGHTPKIYEMRLAMTISGSEIFLDFTGTDEQAPGLINASYSNTRAAALGSLLLFFDPTIPHNHGFFRPMRLTVPEGTLLNPRYPGPVSASTTEAGGRVYDLVLRALSEADPERGIGTWSMMWLGVRFSGSHPKTQEEFIHWMMDGLATGGGARRDEDGWSASSVAASNCLIPNVEIEEQAYPVRYIHRELVSDSGGPGKFRGGLAMETEIVPEVDCLLTVLSSRRDVPPQGIFGGGPGAPCVVYLDGPDSTRQLLPQKVNDMAIKAGVSVIMRPVGGGGYGDPNERSPQLLRRDLEEGFVSEGGLEMYGTAALGLSQADANTTTSEG